MEKKEIDMVNSPPHYNNSPAHCACGRRIECIDVTRYMSFNIGNIIKYLWRIELYANSKKCKFFKFKLKYLGFLINKKSLRMDFSRVKIITKWRFYLS